MMSSIERVRRACERDDPGGSQPARRVPAQSSGARGGARVPFLPWIVAPGHPRGTHRSRLLSEARLFRARRQHRADERGGKGDQRGGRRPGLRISDSAVGRTLSQPSGPDSPRRARSRPVPSRPVRSSAAAVCRVDSMLGLGRLRLCCLGCGPTGQDRTVAGHPCVEVVTWRPVPGVLACRAACARSDPIPQDPRSDTRP
jgi:hypothetical protein